jgi:hypothetical protein
MVRAIVNIEFTACILARPPVIGPLREPVNVVYADTLPLSAIELRKNVRRTDVRGRFSRVFSDVSAKNSDNGAAVRLFGRPVCGLALSLLPPPLLLSMLVLLLLLFCRTSIRSTCTCTSTIYIVRFVN